MCIKEKAIQELQASLKCDREIAERILNGMVKEAKEQQLEECAAETA